MYKKITILILNFILACLFANVSLAKLPAKINHIYFFGDSLTDMGNAPGDYPDDFEGQAAPVTNWIEKNGKYLPSETWAEFFAVHYGLHAVPSNQGGTDWAYSGATTTDVINKQIDTFINEQTHKPNPATTLYTIWIGANDLLSIKSPDQASRIITQGVLNTFNIIAKLYSYGARQFLVVDIPDVSLAPLYANPKHFFVHFDITVRDGVHEAVTKWNQGLYGMIYKAAHAPMFPGIQIYYYDVNPIFNDLVNNPAKYGFRTQFNVPDPEDTCGAKTCKNNQLEWAIGHFSDFYGVALNNANDLIFHNSIHPTTHTHKIFANALLTDAQLIS